MGERRERTFRRTRRNAVGAEMGQDWLGYCQQPAAIVEALACRINRENRELYPLLEAMDKAA
jgi:hypothetical protein